jgi:hypothetical protein
LTSYGEAQWDLVFRFKQERPKNGEDAVKDLEAYIARFPKNKYRERDLFAKYHDTLIRFVKSLPGPLLYPSCCTIQLALKDQSITLLLTSVGSTNVYNVSRLTAKERAAKELEATVLPAVRWFNQIESDEFENFGVVVFYGTQDFSGDDFERGLSAKPELVALVAPAEKFKKLSRAEITEEDFVERADVYLVDRDHIAATNPDAVRKVKVSLGNR